MQKMLQGMWVKGCCILRDEVWRMDNGQLTMDKGQWTIEEWAIPGSSRNLPSLSIVHCQLSIVHSTSPCENDPSPVTKCPCSFTASMRVWNVWFPFLLSLIHI